jgi:hypothetical protein
VTVPTTEYGALEENPEVCCFALQRINFDQASCWAHLTTATKVFAMEAHQLGQALSILNWGMVGERT